MRRARNVCRVPFERLFHNKGRSFTRLSSHIPTLGDVVSQRRTITTSQPIKIENCVYKTPTTADQYSRLFHRNFHATCSNFDGQVERKLNEPKAQRFSGSVKIALDGGKETSTFNTTWLRENCHCAECYTAATSQRKVLFHRLDQKAFVANEVTCPADGNDTTIKWADGHVSSYDNNWLKRALVQDRSAPTPDRLLWNKQKISDVFTMKDYCVGFDDVLREDEALKVLLKRLVEFGVGVVDGCPANLDSTERVVERIAFLQTTFYGKSWEFSNANMDFKDTAYTNVEIGPHNDGTYFTFPPGLQVFHCLHHDSTGGETILVDGFNCAEILREDSPDAFRLLSSTRLGHDFAEPELKNRSQEPILKVDPTTGDMEWIRYNPYDRSAFSAVSQADLAEIYAAVERLARLIDDADNQCLIKLKPGTVIFIDNWRVLHGRTAFVGVRRMCGCYVGRDDWMRQARNFRLIRT